MASTGGVWIYPSGGGNWGLYYDYTWDSSSRKFNVTKIHGQRSNYRSNGNGTFVYQLWDNYGNYLNGWSDYVTMEFTKAAWSTGYWLHDYYSQNTVIAKNVTTVYIRGYTTSDAFNSFIKSKTWPDAGVTVGAVYNNVAYNANGGSSTPSTQSVIYGGSCTLASAISRTSSTSNPTGTITISYNTNGGSTAPTASTGTYTNTKTVSYSFEKWHDGSTSGTAYAAGGTLSNVTSGHTMYAGWTSSTSETRKTNPSITLTSTKPTKSNSTVSSYAVSYNANGGSSTPSSQTATKTRAYTFSKWNSNSSGTGTDYNSGTAYTFSASTTLYAKYTTSDSGGSITLASAISKANGSTTGYSVSYDANGGSGAPSAQTSGNRTITYTFSKWAAGSTSGTQYAAGASYTPSAATTMYAIWSSSTSSNSSWTCSSTVPTRTNYTFKGWSTSKTATTATYTAGTAYTITGALTLYAVWELNKYYYDVNGRLDGVDQGNTSPMGTFSMTVNGGTKQTGLTDFYQQITHGQTYEVSDITANAGYTYTGYTGSLSGTMTAAANSRLIFTTNSYDVSYNANGGTSTPDKQTAKYNTSVTLADGISKNNSDTNVTITITYNANNGSGAPSASTGTAVNTTPYTFNKWALNSTSGTAYSAGASYTIPASNSTMYATWTVGTTTRKSNPSITLSSTKPTRTGYDFLGWSTSSTATTSSYASGTAYTFSADTTLYAVWKISTYTIAYNANGGSGQPDNQTKTYGVDLTLSSTKPTKSNTTTTGYTVTFNGNGGTASKASQAATDTISYAFSKWNTAAAGTGTNYESGATYTANAAATLYAQYTSSTTKGAITTATATRSNGTSTRTVTYNANGGSCSTTSANSTATITYTMNGWYTATSGGTKRAASGGTYTPTASETVYAQWGSSTGTYSAVTLPSATKSNGTSTRTVTFDANGGSCSTTSLNSTATITYSQTGWYTATTGGTSRGVAGATYTPSASETVYAQYSSTTGNYSAITLPTPTRDNYIFKGWAENSSATSGATGSYTPSKSLTLYATWELAQANMNVKINGAWKKGPAYVKINGEWKPIKTVYIKVNGTWKVQS